MFIIMREYYLLMELSNFPHTHIIGFHIAFIFDK